MITKKACDCVRKCDTNDRFSKNFKKEDIRNLFSTKHRRVVRVADPINQSNDLKDTLLTRS